MGLYPYWIYLKHWLAGLGSFALSIGEGGPGMGLNPDAPDERDYQYTTRLTPGVLPERVDLRPSAAPVANQGSIGACTSFSTTSAMRLLRKREGKGDLEYSQLFLYFCTRMLEGNRNRDSGATLRNTMKAANKIGVSKQALWPYLKDNLFKTPPLAAYVNARSNQVLRYSKVQQTQQSLKQALADGQPIVFGFQVYDSFYRANKDGKMPPATGTWVGNHAIVAVGYTPEGLIIQNSWGIGFGDFGFFYMPWDYALSNKCFDFWTLELVEA